MLRLLFFSTVFLLISCRDLKPTEEEFPVKGTTEWITYEGRVPLNNKDYLCFELSMLPGNPGEGNYRLREWVKTEEGTQAFGEFQGTYASFSTADGEIELHFQNSSYPSGLKRTSRSADGKRIREEEYRVRDLVLRKDGDNKLIALDNANQPISYEDNDNLSKRISNVFTVEGTFAHVGDSSVFYETNTEQVWPVSKEGEYDLAIRQYHQLANSKNEGVYLKGTGFSIYKVNARGKSIESLVFKKIISMSSTEASN
ncbi:MAG TPA: hypothetical protein VGD65_11515 [Chryseosolibacter sp.]